MEEQSTQPEWGKKLSKFFVIPQRYIFAIMGFFAIFNAYTMRICLSVVITQLVVARNYTADTVDERVVCPVLEEEIEGTSLPGGDYEWSQELQGYILSSFYVGYLITHIPGGILSEKVGAKWVLNTGIFLTSAFTLITPLVINVSGAYGLIALRILIGLGEGPTFPALSVLISQWAPKNERALIGSLVLGGGQIGTIIGNTISGLILRYYTWELVFYTFGIVSLFWCTLFALLCYNDPESHPYIKQKEKDFLTEEMGTISRRKDLPPTPWKHIFTSVPMYALICAQIGHDWSFFVMSTDLPKYLNDVMQIPIAKNGFFSSLPFGVMWIVSIFSGWLTDLCIRKNYIAITPARKINTLIAAVGPSCFVTLASYAGCDRNVVVAFFTIGMGLMGPYYAGMKLTPIDMSRNYAGTLMAIANGIGSITGILAPTTVGWMTPNTTIYEWRGVFWVAFGVLVVSGIQYVIWASGERQPWDEPDKMPKKET